MVCVQCAAKGVKSASLCRDLAVGMLKGVLRDSFFTSGLFVNLGRQPKLLLKVKFLLKRWEHSSTTKSRKRAGAPEVPIYDLRITNLPPLKTTRVKNERKTVEEKGVKKREKWEDFERGNGKNVREDTHHRLPAI